MQNRVLYFDYLRGVAIIFVVAIHSFFAVKNSASFLDISIRNFMNIAVPLFFGISGFFLAKKEISDKDTFLKFLKKQIPRVYIPVLFCSVPLLIEEIKGNGVGFFTFFEFFFCGYSVYYFVAVIIQCYLLLFLLNKLYNKSLKFFLIVALGILFLNAFSWGVYTHLIAPVRPLPLLLYAGGFWMWGSFFAIGFYLGKLQYRNYSVKKYAVFSAICFGLCLLETFILNNPNAFNGVGQKFSTMFFGASLLPILFSEKLENAPCFNTIGMNFAGGGILSWLKLLGSYSFGIYLIHCYFIRIYRFISVHGNFGFSGTFYWMCLTFVFLNICLFTLIILKKIFPKSSRIFLGV